MTKFLKTLLAVFLSVVIMSLAGCFGDGTGNKTDDGDNNNNNNQNEIEYKTKEEVAELLTNYHFELEIFVEDEDDDEDTLMKMTEIRCENGYYYALDDMAFIADYQGEKFYTLNIDKKTGFSTELDEEDKESFSDSSATYLFSWHTYASYFDRAGTETILGRTCDVYEYDLFYHSEDFVYTYYVDQDLDICLKYEWSDSSENMSAYMHFTKFQLNGVTIEGILEILDEYEITDYSF